jgi:hypothetical protein
VEKLLQKDKEIPVSIIKKEKCQQEKNSVSGTGSGVSVMHSGDLASFYFCTQTIKQVNL